MLVNLVKKILFKSKFRKKNFHNQTYAVNMFDIDHVSIGKNSYGGICLNDWSNEPNKLIIGCYCSIGPNSLFLLGSDHYTDTITTYPLKVKKIHTQSKEALSKGNIIVKDDVWIGANVTICSGVTINQGAIIAAGAVVTKDVPPYTMVGGVPAKIIKKRFSDDIIEKLINLDIVNLLDKCTPENEPLYYQRINSENIDEVIQRMEM